MVDIDARDYLKRLYKAEEVSKEDAQTIFNNHRKNDVDIMTAAVEGGVRKQAVVAIAAEMLGIGAAMLDDMMLPDPLIAMVPAHVARTYQIIPVEIQEKDDRKIVSIATVEPDNIATLDDLRFMLQVDEVQPLLSDPEALETAIEKYYPKVSEDAEGLSEFVNSYDDGDGYDPNSGNYSIDDVDEMDLTSLGAAADSAAVRKLLDLVLITGVKAQAADIHFEPFENQFRVRNRIDGVLYEMLPVPKSLAPALVARVKVMAHLDIAERRLPQDGKISINLSGKSVDLRIACLPTMFGESVVIRILDRSVVSLDLDKIGMPDKWLEYFRKTIALPNGVCIVTGPTGSGKTTTLYAALNEANEDTVKIITTEDPVEYEIDGIIQVNVDEESGRTFQNCLRAILRQDPDKVLVGEVRDIETAKIAIEASLTGHLVFTTLHTNDAPTAITRLVDMGIEPFLVAATVNTILAQRLIRTVCSKCKTPYDPSDDEFEALNLRPEDVAGKKFYYGKGCSYCKETGYKGRTALFEIIEMKNNVRELIIAGAPVSAIRNEARKSGMETLRDAGIAKIFQGVTTIEEVVRETIAMDE